MVDLAGKRVLVTGGAGFVGSHIVDLLLHEDCSSIVSIDNLERGKRSNLAAALVDPRVLLVEGDIRDRQIMRDLVSGADVVFHQAALRITQCAAEPRRAFEVMAAATFDLLEHCAEYGVEKIVAASSASIYGQAQYFPTGEDHPPYGNRTLYGAAKSFNEGLLRAFHDMKALPSVALRYFNVYGPRMDTHGKYTEVLIRWMERLDAGRPPVIFGDGRQTMDFVHVRDVARANVLAAKSEATDEVVNIASGREVSLRELASLLAEVMGRPELTPEFQGERHVNAVARRLADTRKAASMLGFCSAIPLDRGLRDLAEWWRNEASAGKPASALPAAS